MRLHHSVTSVWREQGLRGLVFAIFRRLRIGHWARVDQSTYINDVSREVDGVDVLGYLSAGFGVGEAARTLVHTLRDGGLKVGALNYSSADIRSEYPFHTDGVSRYRTLLASINAEQLVEAHHRLGKNFFENRYVIGQWFWELEIAPPWYEPAWPLVDELWAPTRFIEVMLREHAPSRVEVRYMPLPISTPTVDDSMERSKWDIDDRFMFLFVFDLMSIMKRKNPIGLITAYSEAFGENDGVQLVVKTMNGDIHPDDLQLLLRTSASRSDITIIDQVFTSVETSTLISLADCYVSLHRSEGLGLTLSEAMSHGVPVIATDYSGPTDFMTAENSYLVSWDRVPVGEGAGGYSPTATWAEPRIDDAVAAMREVFANREAARERGLRGQREILSAFSPEASAAIMRERLEEIWSQTGG